MIILFIFVYISFNWIKAHISSVIVIISYKLNTLQHLVLFAVMGHLPPTPHFTCNFVLV